MLRPALNRVRSAAADKALQVALACVVLLAPLPCRAAQPPLPPLPPPAEGRGTASAPNLPPDGTLPPYEPQLDRLAELMGTLSYLRDLCGKGDGGEWRAHMSALLESEATSPNRKERLAGAYNRGLKGYEVTYRTCTPSAELIITRLLAEAEELTKNLAIRFGGG